MPQPNVSLIYGILSNNSVIDQCINGHGLSQMILTVDGSVEADADAEDVPDPLVVDASVLAKVDWNRNCPVSTVREDA
jgi:hypothetical protein